MSRCVWYDFILWKKHPTKVELIENENIFSIWDRLAALRIGMDINFSWTGQGLYTQICMTLLDILVGWKYTNLVGIWNFLLFFYYYYYLKKKKTKKCTKTKLQMNDSSLFILRPDTLKKAEGWNVTAEQLEVCPIVIAPLITNLRRSFWWEFIV